MTTDSLCHIVKSWVPEPGSMSLNCVNCVNSTSANRVTLSKLLNFSTTVFSSRQWD